MYIHGITHCLRWKDKIYYELGYDKNNFLQDSLKIMISKLTRYNMNLIFILFNVSNFSRTLFTVLNINCIIATHVIRIE